MCGGRAGAGAGAVREELAGAGDGERERGAQGDGGPSTPPAPADALYGQGHAGQRHTKYRGGCGRDPAEAGVECAARRYGEQSERPPDRCAAITHAASAGRTYSGEGERSARSPARGTNGGHSGAGADAGGGGARTGRCNPD